MVLVVYMLNEAENVRTRHSVKNSILKLFVACRKAYPRTNNMG